MFSGEELTAVLAGFYRSMDSVYTQKALQAGFSCQGCDGVKCCTVDLTLHSFMEMFYLKLGCRSLNQAVKTEIGRRCRAVLTAKREDPFGKAYRNSVCVLNLEGQCSVYKYRPMICRLAGIRHVIVRPDGSRVTGPGCSRFEHEVGDDHPLLCIDRTSYYGEMADLEMNVVRVSGQRTRPLTVSETLEEFM